MNYEQDYLDHEDEVCFEEENLLTNFSEKDLPLYEKVIEEFGDNSLYISEEAYDSYGNCLEDDYSLRTKKPYADRTSFWRLFDSIKKEQTV